MAPSTTVPKTGLEQPVLRTLTPDQEKDRINEFRYDALVEQNKALSERYPSGENLTQYGVHVAGMTMEWLGTYTAEKMGGYFGFTYTDDLDNWMLKHYDIFTEFRRIDKVVILPRPRFYKMLTGEQDMKFDPRRMCAMIHDHEEQGCKHFTRGHGKSIEKRAILRVLLASTENKYGPGVLTKANLEKGNTVATLGHLPRGLQFHADHSFPALLLGRLTYQLKNSASGKDVFTGSPYPNSRVLVFDGEIDTEDIFRAHRMYGYWKASPHRHNSDKKHKFSRKIAKRASYWRSDRSLEEADMEGWKPPSWWTQDRTLEWTDMGEPQVQQPSGYSSEEIAQEDSCANATIDLTDTVTDHADLSLKAKVHRSEDERLMSATESMKSEPSDLSILKTAQQQEALEDGAAVHKKSLQTTHKRVRAESPVPGPSTSTSASAV